jgi:hypothetical protein
VDDFIEVYADALSAAVCERLIERFDAHPAVAPGRAGSQVDSSVKDSLDLALDGRAEFVADVREIGAAALLGLQRYLRRYPFAALGGTSLARRNPRSGAIERLDAVSLSALTDEELRGLALSVFRLGELNVQRYERGRGGYFAWHSEVSAADPSGEKLHRALPFMFYLNDVAEGGETEWFHQRRLVAPRRGTLAIWPAHFTHTHRGRTPHSEHKYIVTSWFLYRRAGRLAAL